MQIHSFLKIGRVLAGLLIIGLGIVILGFPSLSIKIIAILLGSALMLEGLSIALTSHYPKDKTFYAVAELTQGCVFCVFGIIIIINTNITLIFLSIFAILIALLSLLNQGMICYERKKAGLKFEAAVIFGVIHGFFVYLFIRSLSGDLVLLSILLGTYLLSLGALIIAGMSNSRSNSELI